MEKRSAERITDKHKFNCDISYPTILFGYNNPTNPHYQVIWHDLGGRDGKMGSLGGLDNGPKRVIFSAGQNGSRWAGRPTNIFCPF